MPKAKTKAKKFVFKPIKVTLEFTADDIESILSYADFDEREFNAKKLTRAQYRDLAKELQNTAENFVQEIVEGSEQACANDWLYDYMNAHFPRVGDDLDE